MKILYAGSVNLGRTKGDTLHFLQLAKWLDRRGHDLRVVARGDSVIPGFEFLNVEPIRRIPGKMTLPVDDLKYFRKLTSIMSQFNPDVVYQRGVFLLNRFATLRKIPVIAEVNGLATYEMRLRGVPEPVLKVLRIREANVVTGADQVVCVTEDIRRLLIDTYDVDPSRCKVISNGADTELFKPLPVEECRKRVGLAEDFFYIGFVGAFQPWVDFKTMLEAVRQVVDHGIELRVLLIGDGVLEEDVKQLVGTLELDAHVLFVGRVPHGEVPTWIGSMDLAIVPFDFTERGFEGSPLKLFEYMACGRAVLGTDLPGTAEYVRAGNAGLLYPIGDAGGFAAQLERLYADETLRLNLGLNGFEYASRHHSWDAVAEQIEEIAFELVSEGRSP